jgi:uncharacterized surface protein with fasciclin (FAS1) repeats
MKKFLFNALLAIMALTTITFVACNDEEDVTPAPQNIVDLAKSTANLSSLSAAIDRAGLTSTLSGTTKFTVFAPTNEAFAKFLSDKGFANLQAVPVDALKNILLNHAVSGEVRSTDLRTGYVNTNATFGTTTTNLSLFISTGPAAGGGPTIGDGAKVATADVVASNGIVHIVDKVIDIPTVVTKAVSNPEFTSLVAALTRADLGVNYVQTLSANGPFTVFAPTNAAFAKLFEDLGVTSLSQIDAATLNAVLQYHVVAGANVRSTQLQDEQQITTFQGGTLRVDLTGGAKLVDAGNRVANIAVVDVQSGNGVVHAIDRVVRPN